MDMNLNAKSKTITFIEENRKKLFRIRARHRVLRHDIRSINHRKNYNKLDTSNLLWFLKCPSPFEEPFFLQSSSLDKVAAIFLNDPISMVRRNGTPDPCRANCNT